MFLGVVSPLISSVVRGSLVPDRASPSPIRPFAVSPKQSLETLVRALPNVVRHPVVDKGIESLGNEALAVDDGSHAAHLVG